MEDNEEKEFEVLLANKRHNEIKKVLTTIATSIASNDDKEIQYLIKTQGENILLLANAVKEAVKKEGKEVTVSFDHKEFASTTKKMCDDIIESNKKVINSIENRLLPDTFELIKSHGITQSVKVKYKSAKDINNI